MAPLRPEQIEHHASLTAEPHAQITASAINIFDADRRADFLIGWLTCCRATWIPCRRAGDMWQLAQARRSRRAPAPQLAVLLLCCSLGGALAIVATPGSTVVPYQVRWREVGPLRWLLPLLMPTA
jgi:hypothetical protein